MKIILIFCYILFISQLSKVTADIRWRFWGRVPILLCVIFYVMIDDPGDIFVLWEEYVSCNDCVE